MLWASLSISQLAQYNTYVILYKKELKMKIEPEKEQEKTSIIPPERYSVVIGGGLIILFFAATIGFFCGHQVAVTRFLHKVDEEAFSDKILYALYNINGLEQEEEESLEEATETKDTVEVEVIQEVVETGDIQQEEVEEAAPDNKEGKIREEKEEVVYAAPLIGFGTLHAAEQFVEKLKERDLTVFIKQRCSTTARGRKIRWYQVVTPEYSHKKDLEELISLIQKKEKLQNITIIEKRKVRN